MTASKSPTVVKAPGSSVQPGQSSQSRQPSQPAQPSSLSLNSPLNQPSSLSLNSPLNQPSPLRQPSPPSRAQRNQAARLLQADLFESLAVDPGIVAGVDEAGRGPLAGDVFAAAVILDPTRPIAGLADSKVLTAARRDSLAQEIREKSLAWAVASATVEEIDSINILQATLLAMKRAVESLDIAPQLALVDGNQPPRLLCAVQTIIKGDALVPAISAASILAKTARDADLMRLHTLYPEYGFDQHKGYGTALHIARLQEHGPCAAHRRTFSPVRELLEK